MRFTCIDSFSGAGGLSLGLSKAGFEILYSFDIDKHSVKTQLLNRKYFNHKIQQQDIREFDPEEIMKALDIKKGELSLFAGGPPCQGFSIQRIGEDQDDRNNFVFVFIEKMIALSPKFFLLENVPGINGKRGKKILEDALVHAENNGYYIHKNILNAQEYGVPQRRKRIIIIGERESSSPLKFSCPMPSTKKISVRDTIGHLPAPPKNGKEHPDIKHHRSDKLSEINIKRIKYVKEGQGMAFLPEHLLADCHKAGADKIGHRNVYGRMKWDDVAPTITARFDSFTRGMFGHPEQNRTISLREGALLQTFPSDFEFVGNKVDIARQIGNAVPVSLAFAIGKELIKALK
jgi:DNA (cytosine-5)-methyltransferase 1